MTEPLHLVNLHGAGARVQVQGTTGTGPFPEDPQAEIEVNTIGGFLNCYPRGRGDDRSGSWGVSTPVALPPRARGR